MKKVFLRCLYPITYHLGMVFWRINHAENRRWADRLGGWFYGKHEDISVALDIPWREPWS